MLTVEEAVRIHERTISSDKWYNKEAACRGLSLVVLTQEYLYNSVPVPCKTEIPFSFFFSVRDEREKERKRR